MKTYHIHRDILDEAYEGLVMLLGKYCGTCRLVSHGAPIVQSCRDALSRLADLGEVPTVVSEWHGTRLEHGATAVLHSFPMTPSSQDFLMHHVRSLFSWRWPDNPEDLCLLAPDGTPILFSTAHEQYAQLSVADYMRVDVALEAVLKESSREGICGLVVTCPAGVPACRGQKATYIGIEGNGWPVEMADMPIVSFGLAPVSECERSVSYWRRLMHVRGFEDAKLLCIGCQPPGEGFSPIGFDCGYYSNEEDNFSLILNELHLRTIPSLVSYKSQLNEYGLMASHAATADFMRRALSEPVLRDLYRGCLEDLSIVQVYRMD